MTKSSVITLNTRISFQRKIKSSHKSKWQRYTEWAEGQDCDAVKQERCDFSIQWWRKWLFHSLSVNLKIVRIKYMFWSLIWFLEFPPEKLYGTHSRKLWVPANKQTKSGSYKVWKILKYKAEAGTDVGKIDKPVTHIESVLKAHYLYFLNTFHRRNILMWMWCHPEVVFYAARRHRCLHLTVSMIFMQHFQLRKCFRWQKMMRELGRSCK